MTHAPESAPGDVLQLALRLRDDWRYDEVAALCDRESATAFFKRHLEACEPPAMDAVLDEYSTWEPEKARVVAARLADRSEQHKRTLVRDLPRVSSFDDLVALKPEQFLSRWLESMDVRYDLLKRLRAAGRTVPDWLLHSEPGIRYEIARREQIDASTVRVYYRQARDVDGQVQYGAESFELVRRAPNGKWELIVQALLLQTQGGTLQVLPAEFSDLFSEDAG